MIAPRTAFSEPDAEATKATAALPLQVEDVFGEGGSLTEALGLEYRPQQERMASVWSQAVRRSEPVLIEAGTGVGKSLAYLVPALLFARQTQRQAVISTNTIALQEQLQANDLPLCRNLFERVKGLRGFADFQSAVLVGKSNYLCTTRLERLLSDRGGLFPETMDAEIQRLTDWSQKTQTGLVQELTPSLPPDLWEAVNADSSVCSRKNCAGRGCFYRKAKAAIESADVIIVNHALLFALLGAGFRPGRSTPGVLYPNDFVVLDEAHTVPAVATDHFGAHLSRIGVERLLKRLYNPRNQKGLLRRYGTNRDCLRVTETLRVTEGFFGDIRQRVLEKNAVVRLHEANWAPTELLPGLRALVQTLGGLASRVEEGPEQDEMRDAKQRVARASGALASVLELTEEDHVYWVEKSGRSGQNVTLRSAPIDVAPYLREHLFERQTGVLLTSATLADDSGMDGFAARVGAEGIPSVIESSPFDYERNVRIRVARKAPAMGPQGQIALDWLAQKVRHAISDVAGGSLVLFTSYADLHGVARQLSSWCEKSGRALFVQGQEGSRTELARQFAAAGNGVLMGTDSFWTGIDVPGPALSQVIITRLPFPNPRDPIREARNEAVEKAGGNSFYLNSLPEAVIQFRQGIGRLIRKATDTGVITVLDPRLVTKPYGIRFLNALPRRDFEFFGETSGGTRDGW